MDKKTRRSFLSSTGVALLTSLAGCSDFQPLESEEDYPKDLDGIDDNEPVIAGVDYPLGFSKEGITDIDEAFGSESNYYNLSSVSIIISSYRKKASDYLQQSTISINSSGEKKRMIKNIEENGSLIETQFQTEDTLYTRISRVKKQKTNYSREFIYSIDELKKYVSDISFSANAIENSNIVYKNSEEISKDSSIFNELPNTLKNVSATLIIRYDGIPVKFEVKGTKTSESSEKIIEGLKMKFHLYNLTNVRVPSWIDEYNEQ